MIDRENFPDTRAFRSFFGQVQTRQAAIDGFAKRKESWGRGRRPSYGFFGEEAAACRTP
jgi:hypothetical protein